MDFQKVEACCADTVIIVRYAVSRLSASKPMTGISILSFFSLCIPFFCRKGIHNLLSGNGFPGSGSMWHRLVEVGTDLVYILNSGNQECVKIENKGLIQT